MTLTSALRNLFTNPLEHLVRRWNWKAAFFSSIIRAAIFFCANLTAGWRAATGAMLAEFTYRAATSGFFGAMTANFRKVEPEWQAMIAVVILMPLASHSLEFALHYLRHTPNLKASIISSVIFTNISTLFNLYIMRRGTLVVGREGKSFGQDMRSIPRLIAGFVAAGPLWIWRSMRGTATRPEATSIEA